MKKIRTIKLHVYAGALPDGISAMSAPTDSKEDTESYFIFLDDTEPQDEQTKAFLHEMLHVYRRDHVNGGDISEIERTAHDIINQITKEGGL